MVFNYFGTYYPNLTFIRVKREIRGGKKNHGGWDEKISNVSTYTIRYLIPKKYHILREV
jgi:hypothetical protein